MMQTNKIRKIITISGWVQGVGFRFSTFRKANELKINGLVKNLPDYSVYIDAEGTKEDMDKFINWCHKGPASAIVNSLDIKTAEYKGYTSFQIED